MDQQPVTQPAPQSTKGYGKRPLWQWIVLYLIIGGIIYAGVYYFFLAKHGGYSYSPSAYQTSTNPIATGSAQQNVVTLTANGFSPDTLTIKVGDTVTWINNSGTDATVNSDPHPTHTNYPPLNLGPFSNGQTHTLQFPKAGTYGYHNHYNPNQHGTIVVQ